MTTVVIRHKVGNFDTWLKGHQDRVNAFSPVVSSFKTFRDADDPNSVAMVMQVADLEKLGEMVNDPKLKPFKEKHTVIEPIVVSFEVAV
ncbi:MAG: hypothetical protein NTW10_00250 [Bacteroidetes bacterium]|nr:hypothetical protein [Bacteroidota bacterium]